MMAALATRIDPRKLALIAGVLVGVACAGVPAAAESPFTTAQRPTKPSEPPAPAPPPPDVQPRSGVVEPPRPTAAQPAPKPEAKPGPTAPPPPIELARIPFAAGSAILSREARAMLDKLAATLKTNAKMRALLKAYSTTGTSISETRRLSLQRGTAVRGYLVDKGIAANRIDLQPLGNSDDGAGDWVDIVQGKS